MEELWATFQVFCFVSFKEKYYIETVSSVPTETSYNLFSLKLNSLYTGSRWYGLFSVSRVTNCHISSTSLYGRWFWSADCLWLNIIIENLRETLNDLSNVLSNVHSIRQSCKLKPSVQSKVTDFIVGFQEKSLKGSFNLRLWYVLKDELVKLRANRCNNSQH